MNINTPKEDELRSKLDLITQEWNSLNGKTTITITENTSDKDIEDFKLKLKKKKELSEKVNKELIETTSELKKIKRN